MNPNSNPPARDETPASRGLDFAHRWLPRAGRAGATLVLLHGTGGNEDSLLRLGQALAPEANLLGVRGKVLENGLPRFFRRLAEGVFDQEDLSRRTGELARFLAAAAHHYDFGLDALTAVGYSNGANMAASLLLRRPEILPRGILLRAMVPFTPTEPLDLRDTAALICAGRRDPIVPVDQPAALAALLEAAGAQVTLEWQDAGHELTDGDLQIAQRWLARG